MLSGYMNPHYKYLNFDKSFIKSESMLQKNFNHKHCTYEIYSTPFVVKKKIHTQMVLIGA